MKTNKINKVSDIVERELRHYFMYEDFGPKSPCLEILSFGTYDISPPHWPHGADHRIMIRVREILLLAEGHCVNNITLPPELTMRTKSKIYDKLIHEAGYDQIYLRELEKPGVLPVLGAYYGPYGLQAQSAEGTQFANTKGRADPLDAIIAVYPLTGEPLGQRTEQRARDRIEEIKRDKLEAEGFRKGLWGLVHNKAVDLLNKAHASYSAAKDKIYEGVW